MVEITIDEYLANKGRYEHESALKVTGKAPENCGELFFLFRVYDS